MSPTPKPGILDISPYVGGRAAVPGVAKVYQAVRPTRARSGPSPKAVEALARRGP